MSTYIFSVSADFPLSQVNIDNLRQEISKSNIGKAVQQITKDGDALTVIFKETLSSLEKTELDGDTRGPAGGLIAQHSIESRALEANLVATIREENGDTGGRFLEHNIVIHADAEDDTVYDEAMFVNTSALMIRYTTGAEHQGDSLSVQVAPNTIVGALTADVAADETVLNVSATVVQNVFRGPCLLSISDGVNQNLLGRVKRVNVADLQVIVETPTQNAFAAASPTFVSMTISVIENCTIGVPWQYTIGSSKIGGSFVPEDTVVRLIYHNRSPVDEVGTATSDVALGATVLQVTESVVQKLFYGDKVALRQNSTVIPLGFVTKVDKNRKELYVDTAASIQLELVNGDVVVQKTAKKFIANIEMLQ